MIKIYITQTHNARLCSINWHSQILCYGANNRTPTSHI